MNKLFNDNSDSLDTQYENIFRNFKQLSGENPLTNTKSKDDFIDDTIDLIITCKNCIQNASLFSKDEEFDDFPTNSIKFLYMDYYLAKVYSFTSNQSKRLEYLNNSKICHESMLNTCINLKVIKEEEVANALSDESIMTPEEKRKLKIESFKRNKETNERIKYLENIVKSTEENLDKDYDEELRELLELRLLSFARDSVNEIKLINQEIELLKFKETLNVENNNETHMRQNIIPVLDNGPGLSITKLNKIGDKIVSTQEYIKANVFLPRMEGPTMSLEEYGDRVKAEAEEREKQQSQATANPGIRRYKQLLNDGAEDDVALVDQATIADRDWDAFKEANPKGWGNKMGKRY